MIQGTNFDGTGFNSISAKILGGGGFYMEVSSHHPDIQQQNSCLKSYPSDFGSFEYKENVIEMT